MSAGWLLIEDGSGPRRETLREGLTRVGGRGAEIALSASGAAQLQVDLCRGARPRLVHVGGGPLPRVDGVEVAEADLSPGARIEWAGATLTYLAPETVRTRRPAADALELGPAREALLEIDEIDPAEMAGWDVGPPERPRAGRPAATSRAEPRVEPPAARPPAPGPPAPGLSVPGSAVPVSAAPGGPGADERRAWRRVEAGLLAELGLADKELARAWQARVRDGGFDPDRCADELLAGARTRRDPARLLERCGRLQRDLLMSPLLRGVKGAGRAARTASKGLLAMLLAQSLAVLVYSLILALALLLLRQQGHDPSAWLDSVLHLFGLAPRPPG